jgi:hypothetical protein
MAVLAIILNIVQAKKQKKNYYNQNKLTLKTQNNKKFY